MHELEMIICNMTTCILPVYIVSTEIAHFMDNIMSSFPHSWIPIEMHMLEEHIVPSEREHMLNLTSWENRGAESIQCQVQLFAKDIPFGS